MSQTKTIKTWSKAVGHLFVCILTVSACFRNLIHDGPSPATPWRLRLVCDDSDHWGGVTQQKQANTWGRPHHGHLLLFTICTRFPWRWILHHCDRPQSRWRRTRRENTSTHSLLIVYLLIIRVTEDMKSCVDEARDKPTRDLSLILCCSLTNT